MWQRALERFPKAASASEENIFSARQIPSSHGASAVGRLKSGVGGNRTTLGKIAEAPLLQLVTSGRRSVGRHLPDTSQVPGRVFWRSRPPETWIPGVFPCEDDRSS